MSRGGAWGGQGQVRPWGQEQLGSVAAPHCPVHLGSKLREEGPLPGGTRAEAPLALTFARPPRPPPAAALPPAFFTFNLVFLLL